MKSPRKCILITGVLVAAIVGCRQHHNISAEEIDIRATRSLLQTMCVAVLLYSRDCGETPSATDNICQPLVVDPGVKGWNGPYLESRIVDRWGNPFRFRASESKMPIISSAGPDQRFSTGDDISLAITEEKRRPPGGAEGNRGRP